MVDLAEALSQSDLRYKADVIDPRSVDPAFRAMIEPDMIDIFVQDIACDISY